MNGASGFKEVWFSISRSPAYRSCTSNGINSEEVPGTFSTFTISSLSPETSAQFLTPFSCSAGRLNANQAALPPFGSAASFQLAEVSRTMKGHSQKPDVSSSKNQRGGPDDPNLNSYAGFSLK